MASNMKALEMENVMLKEDFEKLTNPLGQKVTEEQVSPLLKVCTYVYE